jgi:hypothetical protein
MSWVAVAVVGGAVIGGVASNSAAKKGANAQTQAAEMANQTQLEMFNQNREDMRPWRDKGGFALNVLGQEMSTGGALRDFFTMKDFQADPGYAFRQQQGQQALERSAAARGGLLSGGTGKALQRYGQDYASGEFSNAYNRFNNDRTQRFNRLASLAGIGQTATRDVANMGTQLAGNIAENQIGVGNARAAASVGGANAMGSAANQIGNYFQMRQFLGGGSSAAPAPAPSYGGGTTGDFSVPGGDYAIYG